jgi:hypothetical protein
MIYHRIILNPEQKLFFQVRSSLEESRLNLNYCRRPYNYFDNRERDAFKSRAPTKIAESKVDAQWSPVEKSANKVVEKCNKGVSERSCP